MKLGEYFEKLGRAAFGPLIPAFRKLFLLKELDQDIIDIYPEEIKEDSKKIIELKDKINKTDVRLLHVNGLVETKELKIEKEELSKLEKKVANVPCKSLVILSNNVEEVEANASISSDAEKIEKYKANIVLVFNKITKKEMQDFYEFITNLPADSNKWNDYFQQLEAKKGYDPINALKNVPHINELVEKFAKTQNIEYKNHYEAIGIGVSKLLECVNNPHSHVLEEVPYTGDITYGCGGV